MKRGGFTITEMVVSLGIASVVITFALFGFNEFISAQNSMRKRVTDLEDLSLVKLKLGLGVGGGHLRLFMWTGNGPVPTEGTCTGCGATGTDQLFGRFTIPFPNRCRDLTSTCENGVALVTAMPAVSRPAPYAYCMIGGNQVLTMEAGTIGPLVALISPPNGSLFFVTGAASSFTDINSPTVAEACREGIRRQFGGTLPPGPYFTYPVVPAIATNYTGGNCVCQEDRQNAVAEYPVRMINVDVYSLGLLPDPTGTQGSMTWGMVNCEVTPQGSSIQLNCARNADFMMRKVRYVEVDQQYRVVNMAAPGLWYSLNPAPDARFCKAGECVRMTVPTTGLKARLPNETLTTLQYDQFSLMKQEVLKKMRFTVLQDDGKVQSAEIQF